MNKYANQFLDSKKKLIHDIPVPPGDPVEEGGCGVVGFAANVPVSGKNIFEASYQMHNRGNGKGGGIAAAKLVPEQLGVDASTLKNDYILQVALLDESAEAEVEKDFIAANLDIHHKAKIETIANYQDAGLEVKPPDIVRYFVRAKEDNLAQFASSNKLQNAPLRSVEDEFIYQNSFKLNNQFYASLGDKRAFVMSHARDLLIFKIVGYAEQLVTYYQLEDFKAHIYIAHQRYPTKGRVWHPGGAHPFIGMNEALVHNGDFANYFSISEYLRQHNVLPQFLTDTEVAALCFDMLHRTYGYPVEYVIEALAPTTELDFDRLPKEKQKIYRAIQAMHMHGSPDGPWFFIIARSNPDQDFHQLLGITDTAMLRPQVFALQEGDVSIGLVGSEKQAIDATLKSLSKEDPRFRPVADSYWNARGGSYNDGGSFSFTVKGPNGHSTLSCEDKFGNTISGPTGDYAVNTDSKPEVPQKGGLLAEKIVRISSVEDVETIFTITTELMPSWNFDNLRWLIHQVTTVASQGENEFHLALKLLSRLNNRPYDCGSLKRSVVLGLLRAAIDSILDKVPNIMGEENSHARRLDWNTRNDLRAPQQQENTLVIYANEFPPEGDDCDASLMMKAYKLGWDKYIVYGLKGQRFTGCGFGPGSENVRIDVYGSSGDYLASGINGMEIHVHDSAQDQLGQIMKKGKLVVYGDVGQAFMYGAKGGDVYILGNAAGRPLINAVGRPRVVINGTALDFLAESFMAGDPHNGGGFVVLNGLKFNNSGKVVSLDNPYPGANLFSLASGGAIYIRDPENQMLEEQLNGAEYAELTDQDWQLIRPYLEENERLFGISIDRDLLTINGIKKKPSEVYKKVLPALLKKQEVPENQPEESLVEA
ncbi:MAG: glutamate synthase [Fibrobacteria bacterium]|nr:glutamate synthase [Fibrobacteria bacterium]